MRYFLSFCLLFVFAVSANAALGIAAHRDLAARGGCTAPSDAKCCKAVPGAMWDDTNKACCMQYANTPYYTLLYPNPGKQGQACCGGTAYIISNAAAPSRTICCKDLNNATCCAAAGTNLYVWVPEKNVCVPK